ncbi:MAG TPA: TraB/GumN family protein [Cellvibrio sp.]|nr:TraB/GumN family protein [Cellvibrio sp.]
MVTIKKITTLLILLFLPLVAVGQIPEVQGAERLETQSDEIDEILVIGEQPGPGLWLVYKGDHVLRVLGTISPIPKNMQWQSKQVEAALAESQEFITPPGVKVEVGFWGKLGVLPSLIGIKNNPDSKKLADVLTPELYRRWVLLKDKYIGKDQDVEKQRPIFAASELFKKSIEKSDLVSGERVRWVLENVVRNHKIKTTQLRVMHELQSPRAAVKKFKKSTLDDTQCFAKTLERLESDLDAMRARANAWSVGDIEALRNLPYVDNRAACEDAVLNSELVQDQGLQDIKTTLKNIWLEAAEAALTNNTHTFASLPMEELLKPDGYLAALAAKGYKIEAAE